MIARIICLIAGEYTIYDEKTAQILLAKPRGLFRKENTSPKVGDIVEYEAGNPYATIIKVYQRHNDFVRPPIANIDQAFIITSVCEPTLNLNLLDKMISIFEFQRIEPILIFSKMDLLDEKGLLETTKIIQYYAQIGYQVIQTMTTNPLTIEKIKPFLQDKVSVFTGQSGVGKSSIMNLLDNQIHLETAAISKALNRGKHTTRYTKLFMVGKGWLADTPGFGTIEFIDMDESSLAHSFVEFFTYGKECKYNGCLHQNEPSCNVKKKILEGKILKSRYDNYLQFLNEIKSRRKW